MTSALRILVIGLCAAAGIGLAICVATSDVPVDHSAKTADVAEAQDRAPQPAVNATTQVVVSSKGSPERREQIHSWQRPSAPSPREEAALTSANSNSSDTQVARAKPDDRHTDDRDADETLDFPNALRQPLSITTTATTRDSSFRDNSRRSAAPAPSKIADHANTIRGADIVASPASRPTPLHAALPIKAEPREDIAVLTKPIVAQVSPPIEQQIPAAGSPQVRKQVQDELREFLEAAQKVPNPESVVKPKSTGAELPGKTETAGNGVSSSTPPVHPKPKITRIGEGDDHLTLDFQEADIRDVLEMISTEGQLNILPSNSVKGKVSASLHDVDLQTALSAILKSTGYVTRRHGKFIYVGTAADFQSLEQSLDRVGTRIYHTNYVRAQDLQVLITPLLTQGVGTISVTVASEQGIAADGSKAGGDTFAGGDAVLVRDYEAVLAQIDQVVGEIDRRPMQVAIEAMILSVKLDDGNQFGVNFELLRDKSHVLLASGSPESSLGDVSLANGGLNFGFLDSTLGAFLSAVETVGDTHVIATPRVVCINKHRAEILIGSQLGYVSSTVTETSTAQNVNFLEVGTQLRLRPFISSDGLIRMEVHPELSTGQVTIQQGFTLPQKDVTQVTTNVMVRDGATVVIGGLIREDLSTNTTQIPWLGNLPGVGFLFRQKNETTQRSEILVLLTPHIVYDNEACAEGSQGAEDFHRREAVYADQMSPLGKRHLGRQYLRLAQEAWARGDQPLALRFIDLSIHFDPLSRAAIDLRSDILTGNHEGRHTAVNFPQPDGQMATMPGAPGESLPAPAATTPGAPLPPWMLNALEKSPGVPGEGIPVAVPMPMHPLDPGVHGEITPIERPHQFQPQ